MEKESNTVTLFSNPIITIKTLVQVLFELFISLLKTLKNKYVLATTAISMILLILFPTIRQISWFITFWILTGVASSIGLGTGLHTFVLYLLPHVASVMTATAKCGGIAPPMLPSRYNFEYFGPCVQTTTKPWLTVLWAIQFQSILWGMGSAIGELPPYFIAKEAAQSKLKSLNDISDNLDHSQEQRQTLNQLSKQQGIQQTSQEVKELIITGLKKYGFITILFLASIPNPFFDLAGLACGHFGIAFMTFFSATFIGKSFIKVHIQIIMVMFLLSEQFLQSLLRIVDQYFPKLHPRIVEFVQHEKGRLFSSSVQQSTWFQSIWSGMIILMVSYFIISIINTVVQRRLAKNQQIQQL